MSAADVLTIGETMVMVTPQPGGRLDARSTFILRPGGAESNVAASLAMLGHSAAWASAVGADPLGDLVVDTLRGHGVDVSLVRRDPRRPTAVYFKDPAPTGTSVYYYRTGSAASALSTGDLAAWAARHPRVTHLTGITPALSKPCHDLVRRLVHDRPLAPSLLSFDVNHRAALWPDGGGDELRALARASDVVFVGRDEAHTLWGTTTAESVRALLPEPPYLIVKDAEVEAVAFTPSGTYREPSCRVEVVDAVGAGDAFAAGWLSGLLDGLDEPERLRLGHRLAARVLRSPSDLAGLSPADRKGVGSHVADGRPRA